MKTVSLSSPLKGFPAPTNNSSSSRREVSGTHGASPSRLLIAVADENHFAQLRDLCLAGGEAPLAVHWLAHYETARDAILREIYDVVILDSRHDGMRLLSDMAREGCDLPAIVLMDAALPSRDAAGVICEFLTRDTLDAEQLSRAARAVIGRAHASRAVTRSQAWWRSGGPTITFSNLSGVAHRTPSRRRAANVTERVVAAQARAPKEQLLAGVLEHLPLILGRLDEAGSICEIEGSALDAYGLGASDLRGHRFTELFPTAAEAVTAALAGGTGQAESCLQAGTVDEAYLEFQIFPDKQNHAGAVFVGHDVTRRRRLEQEVVRAVDRERQRLGADLHDEVGQLLTGITCLSTALRDRLRGCNDLAAEDAATIVEITRDALAQTRSLARGLAPVRLARHGLHDCLEDLRAHVQRMHEVEVRLDLHADPAEANAGRAPHLFRIVQEAITNAVRHGGATHVEVSGDVDSLTITDNGRGFDPQQPRASAGSGLGLMEYRAALIGGRLRVTSSLTAGTRIEVQFPPTTTYSHENAC